MRIDQKARTVRSCEEHYRKQREQGYLSVADQKREEKEEECRCDEASGYEPCRGLSSRKLACGINTVSCGSPVFDGLPEPDAAPSKAGEGAEHIHPLLIRYAA